eukprot:XP_011677473.1 PREDICTED: uncharacterized protein LOC105444654 [Strongylocentrotus purpuratus]
MTFSSYTTMVVPEFQRLSQLKTHDFPQRVRIPDTSDGRRKRLSERVLSLIDYCEEDCILATRSGDTNVYCLPLSTPISLERTPLPAEKQVTSMLLPLYASINTTWNMVDPTQGGLPQLLEEIPQPIAEVLVPWLASWEGKRRIETVMPKYDEQRRKSDEEKGEKIKRLESTIETYQRELRQAGLIETPPPRPPRSGGRGTETLAPSVTAKPLQSLKTVPPLTALDSRAQLSEPKSSTISTPQTKKHEDDDDDDEYEYVTEVKFVFERDMSAEEYIEVDTENVTTDDGIEKMITKYDDLLNKYNVIKEENVKLQDEKKKLYEKIEWLQNQVDDSDEYSMISDFTALPSKTRDNYVKVTSSKPIETEVQDTKSKKVPVPVPRITSTSNYSLQPVKEIKPAVPARTDSRNSGKGSNPPVAIRSFSLNDMAGTPSSKDNVSTKSNPQARHSQPATPAVSPKPSTSVSKVTSPTSDHISPSPGDPKHTSLRVPTSPTEISLRIHSFLTREEVGSFLVACKLGQYSQSFIENDVNGELLLALDEQIMTEELGLSKLDARKLTLALKKQTSS